MSKDNCYNIISISIVVFMLSSRIAYSKIIRGPSNTTAVLNESTHFSCLTSTVDIDERSIIWFHYPVDGDGQRNYVFSDRTIRTHYKDRFAIDIDLSTGRFDLLVTRLEMKDAGRYECRDDILKDQGASAELTVLDSHLICESDSDPNGIVGPTQCDQTILADEVQLSCRVNFNGRNVPQMVWKKSGQSSAASKTDCVTDKYNRVTCSTTLSANLQLNGTLYTCESTEQKYSCSWGIDNVLYAFSDTRKREYHTGEEVSCVPNASKQLPCSFQWYNESSTLISTDVMFKPNDPGLYRCQAQCAIRNSSCKFTAMVINVSTVHEPGSKLLLWLLLLIIPVGVIMVVLYKHIWLQKKQIEQRTPQETELLSQEEKDEKNQQRIIKEIVPMRQEIKDISGLTSLDQDVFISRYRSTAIEVYDSTTFKLKREIHVEGMNDPRDIASCLVNGCLYVVTWNLSCLNMVYEILRIDPINGNLLKAWGINDGWVALSVASDGNVIVSAKNIHEFSTDGDLLRTIFLGRMFGQSVKLDNYLFVRCDYFEGRVCLILTKERTSSSERIDEVKILKEFDGELGDSIEKLCSPMYLSVNSRYGSIMVSEDCNNRAVLLSANLDNPRILISCRDYEMASSWRTCFDRESGKWLVSDGVRIIVCLEKGEDIERDNHDLIRKIDTDDESICDGN